MRDRPFPTPLIRALAATVPFVGPETQERASGRPFRARIGANESGFGPAPSVIAAMEAAVGDMWKYGDPENFDLRAALAAHHGVGVDNVLIGEGVDGLLGLSVRMFAEPGAAVVTSLGGYPTFNFHVAGFGARLVPVPYERDRENLHGLAEAARREKPALVYLANPDNPMGSWWEAPEVERFMAALPASSMLLLDEAYGETAPASALPPIDVSRPNVIRLRTFSKAYGLAGLRCGYAIAEAGVIREFEKIRAHYGMNRMALTAAQAALRDQAYLREVVAKVEAGRGRLARIAAENGLRPLPSATNFVAIDCGRDGVFAKAVLDALLARGIFVRKPMVPVLDRCIRVSVGLDHELDLFAEELPRALTAAARG
ncbi:MAG: pyridoxal phosphate-dependent aminotransferase [Rhizobiaceae bacterium]